MISSSFLTPECKPTVTTQTATPVTDTTATGNGNITVIGAANATRRGFCYVEGTSGDCTTADSVAYDDGDFGTGAFTKQITGLSASTGYRVRAYAVNSAGTSYGLTYQVTTTAAGYGKYIITATNDGRIYALDPAYKDISIAWDATTGIH